MSSLVDLDAQGNQLRRDIVDLYWTMERSKSLRARPLTNNIKDFVTRYIREGISFDDAEHILRAAEFSVYERPSIGSTPKDEEYVLATMTFPSQLIAMAEVFVALRPKSPGDYDIVNEVHAEIIVTYP